MNGLPKDAESAQNELLRKALQRCRSQSIEEDNMQKMLSDFNVELVREKFLTGSEKLRHSIYISCVKELGSNPNDVEDVGMLHLIGGLLYGRDYHGLSLPLHQIALEAQHGKRGWDTVNEFMIRLPDFVLSFALLLKDSWDMVTPLHVASREAPLSTVRIMLKYAAKTIEMKDVGGNLPIHIASHYNNDLICKEFTTEYPEALIVTNGYGLTPFDYGHKESTRAIYHGIVEHMIPTEYRFHSFGELLEESLYKSIHPIPVLLLEAVYNRRTLEDIQFFLDQLLDNSIALQCFSQDKFRNSCFQRIVDINSKFELPSSLLSRLYYALSGSAQGYFSLVRNEMTMKQIFGDLMSQGIGSHLSDLHLLMIQKRLSLHTINCELRRISVKATVATLLPLCPLRN